MLGMLGIRRNLLSLLCAAVALFCVGHATDTTTLFFMIDPTTTGSIDITPTVVSGTTDRNTDDDLSAGAIAGIAVGGVVLVAGGAVAVGVIIYCVWHAKAAGKVIPA